MKSEDEKKELETTAEPSEKAEEEIRGIMERLRFQRKININFVRIFFAIFISVSLIAIIPSFRPTVSVSEKRELHKFPEFSFSALFSGDYFDDIGLWYSDTFPCRDDFVSINGIMRSTFGLSSIEIYGDVKPAEKTPDKEEVESEKTT